LTCKKKKELAIDNDLVHLVMVLQAFQAMSHRYNEVFYDLLISYKRFLPVILQAPRLELKPLPDHLKYIFLGNN
jgi:hypothetical protein